MPIAHIVKKLRLFAVGAVYIGESMAQSEWLVAPPYNVQNEHGVNMVTGQVQLTHPGVSIGGDMGLSHSISMHENQWVGYEIGQIWGPLSNFHGKLFYTQSPMNTYWIVVSDGVSTQTFDTQISTTQSDAFDQLPVTDSEGYFKPVGHPGHRLRFESSWGGVVMTKPDGTRVVYKTNGEFKWHNRLEMAEIHYPNGKIVEVHKDGGSTDVIASVTTNTGFQLKYYYVIDHASGLSDTGSSSDVPSDTAAWTGSTPRYVKAINNAVEHCSAARGEQSGAAECSLHDWPKVEYLWPTGMPRRMYRQEATFSVIEPNGKRTDYVHRPFDMAIQEPDGTYAGYSPGQRKLPRLVEIWNGNTGTKEFRYRYENKYIPRQFPGLGLGPNTYYVPTNYAMLIGSSAFGAANDSMTTGNTYNIRQERRGSHGQLEAILNINGGYRSVGEVKLNPGSNALMSVKAWNYHAGFSGDQATLLEQFHDLSNGVVSVFEHDDRGNITSITAQGGTRTAKYPNSCNSSNEKYCNKPEWTEDAKGNRTDYTYHPQSGQLATVTGPANSAGIRPQTRFRYEQRFANYYSPSGTKSIAENGIWMKVEESYCTNSQAAGDGCSGNDEVVTRYEYEHDNLLLTGVTVTSEQDNRTLRTCYQYDIYGNQIGETAPNANLTSCP
ncbi:hypothetical protein [Marinimicrobium alkaliphilum]|uniref:hypothetical protein n=1 Tax=Marinimicrobium alkaliphilum TaxID=2202654 RepID=UPI000DBA4403|nr:hypothetical protein [Marinimicrobium alkaliphilum]